MERLLYRLSRSEHNERYILKGALMLQVWGSSEIRPTMDIDLLGSTRNEEAGIVRQIRDILSVDVQSDGLLFDPTSIRPVDLSRPLPQRTTSPSQRGAVKCSSTFYDIPGK